LLGGVFGVITVMLTGVGFFFFPPLTNKKQEWERKNNEGKNER